MPTGYTEILEKDDDVSFQEFAMRCARAFGALVSMRDDPLSKEIPKELKPSTYHINALADARVELTKVRNMTREECLSAAEREIKREISHYEGYAAKERKFLGRYNAMKEKIKAWTPPTKDHEGLKEFMLEQLHMGSPDPKWYEEEAKKFRGMSPDAKVWKASTIERLKKDIEYHIRENKREIEIARGRTKWVKQLRKSLEKTT